MNREQALKLATETIDQLSEVPKNERGYPRDGWKPPTLPERVASILEVATFLMGPEPHLVPPTTVHPTTHSDQECPGPPECS